MKSVLKRALLACCLIITCVTAQTTIAQAASTQTVKIKVTYLQDDAREMLKDINAFRTGKDAWAWNETDTKKVKYENLGKLTYDYALEEIAMQRAAEIVLAFSHTRPDDTRCFSALSKNGTQSYGENIAAGYRTAEDVFEGWCETEESYAGQGHRRNMLRDYTAIGIGHAVYNGVHYWVQEFGYSISDTEETNISDKETSVKVKVSSTQITSVEAEQTKLTLKKGKKKDLSKINFEISLKDTWLGAKRVRVKGSVTSSKPSVVKVSGNTIIAKKAGTSTIKVKILGKSCKMKVVVK